MTSVGMNSIPGLSSTGAGHHFHELQSGAAGATFHQSGGQGRNELQTRIAARERLTKDLMNSDLALSVSHPFES